MDAAWVSAIGTIIAAGIAAAALVVEGRRLNISRGADLLLRLDELFFRSERMDEARKAAAKALRGEGDPKDIDDVLDFLRR